MNIRWAIACRCWDVGYVPRESVVGVDQIQFNHESVSSDFSIIEAAAIE